MTNPQDDRPADEDAVAEEEQLEESDAVGRLDDDPDAQPQLSEDELRSDLDPDDA